MRWSFEKPSRPYDTKIAGVPIIPEPQWLNGVGVVEVTSRVIELADGRVYRIDREATLRNWDRLREEEMRRPQPTVEPPSWDDEFEF